MDTNEQPLPVTLTQMITAGWVSQSLSVSAQLGIADLLADGPKSVKELATATQTHERSLSRLLRALASIGVYARAGEELYRNSPLSELLRSDVPGSLHAVAKMTGEEHSKAWSNLLHSVRTGETAFDNLYGENWFEYIAKNLDAFDTFHNAMTDFAKQTHIAAAAAYDFSGIGTLADIGGGHGTLLATILKANSQMKGILFDLPHVVEGAPQLLAQHGVQDRVEITSGDFFVEVPRADAHIMSHIIHDWDDERSLKILSSCRRAVSEGGKILLAEMVIPEGDEPFMGKWLDLNMLVMTPGGRERTETEYSELLQQAGYRLQRIYPSQSPVSVVEGVAV